MTGLLLLSCLLSQPERQPATPIPAAEEQHRDALTRFAVGRLRARNRLPVQALHEFEAAAKAEEDSPGPLRPLVSLYAELGRPAAAIRTAKRVMELDPEDVETGQLLARLLYEGRKYADATEVLRRVAESPRAKPNQLLGILTDWSRAAKQAALPQEEVQALRQLVQLLNEQHAPLVHAGRFASETEFQRRLAQTQESLGLAYAQVGKFPEAMLELQAAHRSYLDPKRANDPSAAARLDWNLCEVMTAQKKPKEALTHLERFLALQPNTIAPYERYAQLMNELGFGNRLPEALLAYAEANPKNQAVRWLAAEQRYRLDPAAGLREFRELMTTTTDPRFFDRVVTSLAGRKAWNDLLAMADTLLAVGKPANPDAEPAPEYRQTLERARAFAQAVKQNHTLVRPLLVYAATEATRRQGDHPAETWQLLAQLAERYGLLAQSEEWFRIAMQTNPQDRTLSLLLLDVLRKRHKWDAVIEVAQAIIRREQNLDGRSLNIDFQVALAYAELGNAREAFLALREVENVRAAGQAWAQSRKAFVLNILGRHQDAAKECERLLKFFPKPADQRTIRPILSEAYLGLKQYAKAEAELRTLLDLDPDDAMILNNLGYNLADQGRELKEAETLVRRAIELDADERLRLGDLEATSGTYHDSLGWVYFKQGRWKEAREQLEKAVTMPEGGSSGEEWDHLGDVRFRMGDRREAKEAWERAAELLEGLRSRRNRFVDVKLKLLQVK